MEITVNYANINDYNEEYEVIIRRVCQEAALVYGLEENDEISIMLCDDAYIHKLNLQYRHIDRPTDVLSFALNEGEDEGDSANKNLLGDIVISMNKVEEQATEYGHSTERELAYLTVHGMLHILGYDHETNDDKAEMREEEEYVLTRLGYIREGDVL